MSGSPAKVQTLNLPFDGGMDQRSHPKQLQAPGVLSAVNVRWSNLGAANKRFGTTAIATGFRNGYTFVPGQAKVIGFRDELLATDHYRIGSLSKSAGTNWLVDKGKVPECVSSSRSVDTTQYQLIAPDIAYANGLIFHTYLGAGSNIFGPGASAQIFTTVEDAITGAEIISSEQLVVGSFFTSHLCAVGTDMFLLYYDNVATTVICHKWVPSTMTWSGPTTIITGNIGDAQFCSDGTFLYVAWKRSSNNKLSISKFNTSLALQANIDCSEANTDTGIGIGICATAGELVWLTYVRFSAPSTFIAKAAAYPTSLASETTTPFTVFSLGVQSLGFTAPARLSATTVVVGITATGGRSWYPVASSAGAIVGNASAVNRALSWGSMGSKPFVVSTNPLRAYVWVYAGGADVFIIGTDPQFTPLQYTFMLIDLAVDDTASVDWSARPITWQAPRFSVPSAVIPLWTPPQVANIGGGKWICDANIKRNARSRNGLAMVTADFASGNRMNGCELGQTFFAVPGFYWDRSQMAEISFAYFPQGLKVTGLSTGGILGAGVTRKYRAMYEFIDANGFVHRSAASDAFAATIPSGTTGSFTIEIPCLTVTAKQSARTADLRNGVRLVVYVLNALGLYERLFQEGTEPLNDPRLRSVTGIDTGNISRDIFPEILYTESGVFPNVMPAGFTACVTYRNRVWIAYGHTVAYSKAFVTGDTVSFTDAFELPLEETGDITAMWVLDDALYISTDKRIYTLQANGPNDFGNENDVSTPNRIATDRGVIDQRSVAVYPDGVLYQSSVGIQKMDRGRNVSSEPIGARVQKDLAAFPEIVSTNVHPTGRYVTFCCRSADAMSGIRLVYDYATDRWSRDVIVTSTTDNGEPIFSEAIAGTTVYLAEAHGSQTRILFEDRATFLDEGGIWVTMAVEMAEVHPAGLQTELGFPNWQFLAERKTDHDIRVELRSNYSSTLLENIRIPSNVIAGEPLHQFALNPSVHKAESMRYRIIDTDPTGPGAVVGTGQGAIFVGLAVDIDPINQTLRLPATAKS
jgi:hypothetical protein